MLKLAVKYPELRPFAKDLELRMRLYREKRELLTRDALSDFANAHHYFGFHRTEDGWVYREWAPAADAVYLMGDFNGWNPTAHPLRRLSGLESTQRGVWELLLPPDVWKNGARVKTVVQNFARRTEHLPIYTTYAVQDPKTAVWCAEVLEENEYPWTDADFQPSSEPLLIYEAHVGMAQEEGRIGTYREFAENVLPRVKEDGYNTVQLMAIMEHPYYGSFGYQVSNFFAPSSRFGTPDDLRFLINRAHEMGIRMLLDVVHSHAVKNTAEGINRFDGTEVQFFHVGARGDHPAWDTKCFDYAKPEVLHFLLSNLKYWLESFHFDGFRFDGVTSMLYRDHGLGVSFDDFGKYFSMNTDTDAVTYLQLANELVHALNPHAVTIAEDMSGMPGMCEAIRDGGIGFDYRLAMGLPDLWIRYAKELRDEDWDVGAIWYELTLRNAGTVAYVESHDQALVGDQTMMFRFAGAAMYTDMSKFVQSMTIDRAMALHKMLRLVTIGGGGNGYLNFMGNEFGHPEWIDFPREGNGWSYHYCRRQWSLAEDGNLRYGELGAFDKDMLAAVKRYRVLEQFMPDLRVCSPEEHVLAFERGKLLLVFNFHPVQSYVDYPVPVGRPVDYEVCFSTDDPGYGGQGRIAHMRHSSFGGFVRLYLPARSAVVLRRCGPSRKGKTSEKKPVD